MKKILLEINSAATDIFYPVNAQLFSKIDAKCTEKGYMLLGSRMLSDHPRDGYLTFVLVKREHQLHPYVTFVYNAELNGLSAGNYYDSIGDAVSNFFSRT